MRRASVRRTVVRPLLAIAIATLIGAAGMSAVVPSSAAAAESAPPFGDQDVIPRSAPADEGGDGVSGAKSQEWILFALLLGAFLPLMSGLFLLMFRIDHSEEGR